MDQNDRNGCRPPCAEGWVFWVVVILGIMAVIADVFIWRVG